jgi:uncharacterized protein (DUF305 family)
MYSPPPTRSSVLQLSQAEVAFMRGMIMHYSQAMEMTAMIPSHVENKDVQDFGQIRSDQNGMVESAPTAWDESANLQRGMPVRGIDEMSWNEQF